jgi:hypothetical protein
MLSASIRGCLLLRGRTIAPMVFPDPLEIELRKYKADSEVTVQKIAARSIIVEAVWKTPFAGAAMLEVFNGLAQQRSQERLNKLFDQLKDSLGRLDEEKIDRDYFRSEEFQTLLFLLLEKLHTTHEDEKLRIFGRCLPIGAIRILKETIKNSMFERSGISALRICKFSGG